MPTSQSSSKTDEKKKALALEASKQKQWSYLINHLCGWALAALIILIPIKVLSAFRARHMSHNLSYFVEYADTLKVLLFSGSLLIFGLIFVVLMSKKPEKAMALGIFGGLTVFSLIALI